MNLQQSDIELLAERLENCELEAKDTTKVTDDFLIWIGRMLMPFR